MKDIKGYEGLYGITSCGRVWSYRRNKFLTPLRSRNGYLRVQLWKNGKVKNFQIHRLVAEAYIDNPNGLPQIDHIDSNKEHNYVNNLRWCTAKENTQYSIDNGLRAKKRNTKRVHCVETGRVYNNCTAAARELGLCKKSVWHVCKGEMKSTGGYHFTYVD